MQIRTGFQRAVDRAKSATEQAAQRVADKADQAKDAARRTADKIEANPHFQQGIELAKDAAEKAGDNVKQSGVLKKTEVKQAARTLALGGAQLISAHAKHDALGQAAALHTMKQQFALIGREVATAALHEPKRQESTATSISSALTKLGLPADYSGTLSLRELYADPAKHGPTDAILDAYFGKPADPVVGREATGFLASFPDPDEVEPKDKMKEYLCDKDDTWSISVQVKDGKVVGGTNYNLLETPKGQFGVIEHLWTDPSSRMKGVGRETAQGLLAQMKASNPDAKGVFIEVNDPRLMTEAQIKEEPVDPNGRLAFWSKMGFKAIDHAYAQPSLGEDQSAVEHLMLAYQPLDGSAPQSIDSNDMRGFCKSYFGTWLDEPTKDPTYKQLFAHEATQGHALALQDMREARPSVAGTAS